MKAFKWFDGIETFETSRSYSAIHGVPEFMNIGDITKDDENKLPKDVDLITCGSPCQNISIARNVQEEEGKVIR